MGVERARSETGPDHWIRRAVRLRLDLPGFDGAQFLPYLRRCQHSGIRFTTMAEVGDTAESRRALYELDKICSTDIPGGSEFCAFDEYIERMQAPAYDPRGVVLAVGSGVWVGMAVTSLRWDEGCAVSDMTGVLPSHRGSGIALAMKLLAIEFARSSGMRWMVALHHPGNTAVIRMNRRLGFVDYDPRTG